GGDDQEALFDRAFEFRKAGDDQTAIELYREAYERDRSARALALMGVTEQSLKQWLLAETHLMAALEETSNPWIRANRVHLEKAIDNIASHIGVLLIRGTAGATVYLEGEPRGTLPIAAAIRVGEGYVSV